MNALRPRSLRLSAACILAATTALIASLPAGEPLAVAAAAAGPGSPPDPAGYCLPQSAQFDPSDLGSIPPDPLPSGIGERVIDLAGVRTPVLEAGPRSDPSAVVFVHGNPGSSRDFLGLMAAARPLGLRLVAFDMPGFGRAGRPWSFSYTLQGYLRWFSDALAQLGVRRAILVVHDLGGPEQFAATAIIDSGVLVGYQDHYLARIWKTPVAGEAFMASTTRSVFDTGVQNGQQRPLPQSFVDRMYAEYDRPTRCAILSAYRSVPDVDALARQQAARLAPLDRPALVIWGTHDPYLPTQLAYAQRDAFPSAQIHVFDDAAHWPFIDDPSTVASLVSSFLARFTPSPAMGPSKPSHRSAQRLCARRHRTARRHRVSRCRRSPRRHLRNRQMNRG
jgi:pimeloyl-ACP methyl ester carboxylesterase